MPDSALQPAAGSPLSPEQQAMAGAQRYSKSVDETEKKWEGTLQSDRSAEVQAMNAPALTAPPPAPEQTDPGKAWASTAMLAGVLGGAFTRQHVTTALNGMTGAMQGFRQGDIEASKYNFEKWKAESENAQKRLEFVRDRLQDDVSLMDHDFALGKARFDADSAAFGIKSQILQTHDQHLRAVADVSRAADEHRSTMMDLAAKGKVLDIAGQFQRARQHMEAAEKSGDKAAMVSAQQELKAAGDAAQDWQTAQGKGIGAMLSDDEKASMGAAAAMGQPLNQLVPGYGTQASQARRAARDAGIDYIMKTTNLNAAQAGQELAWRQLQFKSAGTAESMMERMSAGVDQAVKQLDYNLDQASAQMKALKSDATPVLNAILRKEESWSGDPKYTQLFISMHAAMNEAARIMAGGSMSAAMLPEGARGAAQEFMDAGWTTPAQFEGARRTLEAEGRNRKQNFADAESDMRAGLTGGGLSVGGGGTFAPDPSWPSAQGVSDGKVLKDGSGNVVAKARGGQWVDPSTP